ncbi:MAG TPA: aldehyde dehydrogenase family protein [Terrimicrobiaceae bacterium]
MDLVFSEINNLVSGQEVPAASGARFDKVSPHDGRRISVVARSGAGDIAQAVAAAKEAQPPWAGLPAVSRGEILRSVATGLLKYRDAVAAVVSRETGKSLANARGETEAAASLGFFYAGEGQRLYGRTTTSGVANKFAMTVRQPVGVAGLIIAANTPIANVAWKVFPALVCGNSAVLKPAEDTPATAALFGRIAQEAGLPGGLLNIVHGYGPEAGAPLVAHPDVGVVSFTGSSSAGREVAVAVGHRLAKLSLELGGKNPLVVCDDADLDEAVRWTLLSAFSNAGQRCAAGSRIIVFDSVYDEFRARLLQSTSKIRVGPADEDDYGPVINARQLEKMLQAIGRAVASGAGVIAGGHRLNDPAHANGFYLAPTLIEGADPDADISTSELFGPIACLYRVKDFAEALALANHSPYGLTACIHTRNFHRAMEFSLGVQSGVAVVNAGTYGSEPHMPFGGVKGSGNGTREPGTEALDVYSNLKDLYLSVDPSKAL